MHLAYPRLGVRMIASAAGRVDDPCANVRTIETRRHPLGESLEIIHQHPEGAHRTKTPSLLELILFAVGTYRVQRDIDRGRRLRSNHLLRYPRRTLRAILRRVASLSACIFGGNFTRDAAFEAAAITIIVCHGCDP
jgi:hypothetical protein